MPVWWGASLRWDLRLSGTPNWSVVSPPETSSWRQIVSEKIGVNCRALMHQSVQSTVPHLAKRNSGQRKGKGVNNHDCRFEEESRKDLVQFSRWLSRLGFAPGTSGNLSVRLDQHRLLVTPTGVSKALVRRADMVIVDLQGHLLC